MDFSILFDIPRLIAEYGYIAVFLVVFLETALIFPLPGDSFLFTLGILASTGILSMWLLIPIIFVGGLLGGLMGYIIGRHLERLHHYSFFRKIIKKEYLKKAEDFYEKNGKITLLFARFVPVVRTFVSIVAGIIKMNYLKFLKWSTLGALIWSVGMTSLGYFLGSLMPWIKDYLTIFVAIVVFLSVVPLILEAIKGKRV